MIVDLDVHQGDGTASIFEHQDSVFTISFHGQKNYPFKSRIVILIYHLMTTRRIELI